MVVIVSHARVGAPAGDEIVVGSVSKMAPLGKLGKLGGVIVKKM